MLSFPYVNSFIYLTYLSISQTLSIFATYCFLFHSHLPINKSDPINIRYLLFLVHSHLPINKSDQHSFATYCFLFHSHLPINKSDQYSPLTVSCFIHTYLSISQTLSIFATYCFLFHSQSLMMIPIPPLTDIHSFILIFMSISLLITDFTGRFCSHKLP